MGHIADLVECGLLQVVPKEWVNYVATYFAVPNDEQYARAILYGEVDTQKNEGKLTLSAQRIVRDIIIGA